MSCARLLLEVEWIRLAVKKRGRTDFWSDIKCPTHYGGVTSYQLPEVLLRTRIARRREKRARVLAFKKKIIENDV